MARAERAARNLGDPSRCRGSRQACEGINNLVGGRERESERLIVVMKRGNARGAKGPRRKTS